ncbi:MAG: ABC transporter substrate-binding protein [Burkholderiales bacterium]|nr:ABC transporter substrate-binding protein [Anaerolineae bacterium]
MLRYIRVLTVALFSIVFAVTSYAQDEPDLVRVILNQQLSQSHFFIADAEGYFAAQNIDFEPIFVARISDASSYALLFSGEAEALQGAWTPGIFNAVTRDQELRAVASAAYDATGHCPYGAFVVDEGRVDNFDMESLRGATVTMPAGLTRFYLDKYLTDFGMSVEDVVFEDIPQAARGEAVMNNSIELAWLNEPALSRLVNANELDVLVGAGDIVPDGSQGGLFIGPTMLNRDDDLPVRFLTAYLQGIRQFNEGPTERNLEILAPILEQEPESLAEGCWISMRHDGEVYIDPVIEYQQWSYEQGEVDAIVPVEEFYDPTYIQAANERLAEMATPEATAESE